MVQRCSNGDACLAHNGAAACRLRASANRHTTCSSCRRGWSGRSKKQLAAVKRSADRRRLSEQLLSQRSANKADMTRQGWFLARAVAKRAVQENRKALRKLQGVLDAEARKDSSNYLTPLFSHLGPEGEAVTPHSNAQASRFLAAGASLEAGADLQDCCGALHAVRAAIRAYLGSGGHKRFCLVSERYEFDLMAAVFSRGERSPACQAWHTDFPDKKGFSVFTNLSLVPAVLDVAGVYDSSTHRTGADFPFTSVRLEAGDVLVLRGDVLHRGTGYTRSHLRGFLEAVHPDSCQPTVIHNVL